MLRKIREFFSRKEEEDDFEDEELQTVFVWAVVDGPLEDPDDGVWTLIVKASVGESMLVTELYFPTFNGAYEFHSELLKASGPIEVEIPTSIKVVESDRTCLKQQ